MATECRVDAMHAGVRIDAFLALCLPNLGLRGRRRAIANGLVLVNGKKPRPAKRLAAGDVVLFACDENEDRPCERAVTSRCGEDVAAREVRLLGRKGDIFFFSKPPFLHSESLAGSQTPSLARAIRLHCEREGGRPVPVLVQRLDYETSGVVCALPQSLIPAFRRDEREGRVRKMYLALLEGKLALDCSVTWALDTDNRRKTRVLPFPCQPFRQTLFHPLAYKAPGETPQWLDCTVPSAPLTLALCTLFCGARHQIRAHAASLGHPLLGDALYGAQYRANRFYLHGAALFFWSSSFFERPPCLAPSALWDSCCEIFRSLEERATSLVGDIQ